MSSQPVVATIHVAKGRRLPMRSMDRVDIETAAGIVGDRYHGSRHRQVSVQSLTALAEAQAALGRPVPAELTRRNLTIDRGVVPRDPGALIRLGPVLLEVVRVAAPCRLLDDGLGPGGMKALHNRGGSICRVLEGGVLEIGAAVDLAVESASKPVQSAALHPRQPGQTPEPEPRRVIP